MCVYIINLFCARISVTYSPLCQVLRLAALLPCWLPQPATLPTALRADGKAEEKMVRTIMADEAVEGMHVFQVAKEAHIDHIYSHSSAIVVGLCF